MSGTVSEICAVFDSVSEDHDDKSLGWLFQMTAERAGVSYGSVVSALQVRMAARQAARKSAEAGE